MVQYFRAFAALTLLSPLVALPSWAYEYGDENPSLWLQDVYNMDDPKVLKCIDTDPSCGVIAGLTSVCDAKATDQYTNDPKIREPGYFACVCVDPEYFAKLPGYAHDKPISYQNGKN